MAHIRKVTSILVRDFSIVYEENVHKRAPDVSQIQISSLLAHLLIRYSMSVKRDFFDVTNNCAIIHIYNAFICLMKLLTVIYYMHNNSCNMQFLFK